MKSHRIAAIVVFIQSIILPILSGSVSGPDRSLVILFQATLAALCVAVFAEKKWALWTAFALTVAQIPVVETEHITWRVSAGSALSVGILKSASWLDSRIGLNYFAGYVFNGALSHSPVKRLLTDGSAVTGAFMLNLAVIPGLFFLIVRKKTKILSTDGTSPEATPAPVTPPPAQEPRQP